MKNSSAALESQPSALLGRAGKRGLWNRIFDKLFGRDFFISYRWSDGRDYAVALAERLKAERFDCFLDSDGFIKGDNYERIGRRELQKTSRLVLVGSPEVHQSDAVARELQMFGAKEGRIITIEFGDSLSAERYPDSKVVPHLPAKTIGQKEPAQALDAPPSEEVIAELLRTFSGETTAVRRLRAIQVTTLLLLTLVLLAATAALLAYRQYRLNLDASALADSQRAALEVENFNTDLGVAYLVRSLEKNPRDASVASALMRLAVESPPTGPDRVVAGKFTDIAMSLDGNTIALLGSDGAVKISRAAEPFFSLGNIGTAERIAMSPDGRWLAATSPGGLARVDLEDSDFPVLHAPAPPATVTALAIGAKGLVLIGDEQGRLSQWSGEYIIAVGDAFDAPIIQVALMRDSSWFGAVASSGEWRVVDRDGSLVGYELRSPVPATSVAFTPNGRVWAGAYAPGELEGDGPHSQLALYFGDDAENWTDQEYGPTWGRTKIKKIGTDSDGESAIALLDSDELQFVNPRRMQFTQLARPGVAAAAISPDGSIVVTAHFDGSLRRWAGDFLSPLRQIGFAPPDVQQIATNKDASRLALRSAGDVRIFSYRESEAQRHHFLTPATVAPALPASFQVVGTAERRQRGTGGITVRRDESTENEKGIWIVQGAGRPAIRITHAMTDEETDQAERIWESSHFAVWPSTSAAISSDGTHLVTSASDQNVRVWDARSAAPTATLPTKEHGFPTLLAVSPGGKRVLVGSFDVSTNRSSYRIFSAMDSAPLTGTMPLYSGERLMDTTPELDRVLVANANDLELRDPLSGRLIAEPVTLLSTIWRAGFVAEGVAFFLATRDGRFRVWRTLDATPLCAISLFDVHEPNDPGHPGDTYDFHGWEEVADAQSQVLRRLAFRIENPGIDDGREDNQFPTDYRVFDLGLGGTNADRQRLAEMLSAAYGVRLSASGTILRKAPVPSEGLRRRFADESGWDSNDYSRFAEWLFHERFRGQDSPLLLR